MAEIETDFDFNESTYEAYASRLISKVNRATELIQDAFEELKRAERADPQTWEMLLRRARTAYRELVPRAEDLEDAQRALRDIEQKQIRATREAAPDDRLARVELGLPASTRLQFLRDQLESMRTLINDYYARLEDPPTEEDSNLVAVGLLGGAIASSSGIFQRRARFYARDQTGAMYKEASRVIPKQAGAESYIWLRTTSANPRDRHLARVGKEFRYGEVADEPGDLPNCKCGRRPLFRGNP